MIKALKVLIILIIFILKWKYNKNDKLRVFYSWDISISEDLVFNMRKLSIGNKWRTGTQCKTRSAQAEALIS